MSMAYNIKKTIIGFTLIALPFAGVFLSSCEPGDPVEPEKPEQPVDPVDPVDPTDPTDPGEEPGQTVEWDTVALQDARHINMVRFLNEVKYSDPQTGELNGEVSGKEYDILGGDDSSGRLIALRATMISNQANSETVMKMTFKIEGIREKINAQLLPDGESNFLEAEVEYATVALDKGVLGYAEDAFIAVSSLNANSVAPDIWGDEIIYTAAIGYAGKADTLGYETPNIDRSSAELKLIANLLNETAEELTIKHVDVSGNETVVSFDDFNPDIKNDLGEYILEATIMNCKNDKTGIRAGYILPTEAPDGKRHKLVADAPTL